MKNLLLIGTLLASLVPAANAQQSTPPPLETIRNFQMVSGQLASAGQIRYEQIPLLREQGNEVVVNLSTADEKRNGREGFLVTQSGLTYVQIPVEWDVHCFLNMSASPLRRTAGPSGRWPARVHECPNSRASREHPP